MHSRLTLLWLWLVSLLATSAWAGTHGGNGFFTKVNAGFDFSVSLPPSWLCEGCDSRGSKFLGSDNVTEWVLLSPGKATSMRIRFSKDFPAKTLLDLQDRLSNGGDNPSVHTWYSIDRGGLAGFSSVPQPEGQNANAATEYYLVTEGRVIRIEWQKNAAEPDAALQLDGIKKSINRVSLPPRIDYIRSERAASYKIGDEACILIGASDVRNGLGEDSLTDFTFAGQLDHWRYNTVTWEGAQRRFRVCTKVTATFGRRGLRPSFALTSGSSNDDEDAPAVKLSCTADPSGGDTVRCVSDSQLSQDQPQLIKAEVAAIDHDQPELDGPALVDVRVDPLLMTLQLVLNSASPCHLAIVTVSKQSRYIYADELASGKAVSIASIIHEGWNTIERIVVFDGDGVPTVLRLPQASVGSAATAMNYEIVPWKGPARPAPIRIKTFLKGGGFR